MLLVVPVHVLLRRRRRLARRHLHDGHHPAAERRDMSSPSLVNRVAGRTSMTPPAAPRPAPPARSSPPCTREEKLFVTVQFKSGTVFLVVRVHYAVPAAPRPTSLARPSPPCRKEATLISTSETGFAVDPANAMAASAARNGKSSSPAQNENRTICRRFYGTSIEHQVGKKHRNHGGADLSIEASGCSLCCLTTSAQQLADCASPVLQRVASCTAVNGMFWKFSRADLSMEASGCSLG